MSIRVKLGYPKAGFHTAWEFRLLRRLVATSTPLQYKTSKPLSISCMPKVVEGVPFLQHFTMLALRTEDHHSLASRGRGRRGLLPSPSVQERPLQLPVIPPLSCRLTLCDSRVTRNSYLHTSTILNADTTAHVNIKTTLLYPHKRRRPRDEPTSQPVQGSWLRKAPEELAIMGC